LIIKYYLNAPRRWRALALSFAMAHGVVVAQEFPPTPPPRSGLEFAGESIRALQADDFANPGTFWVEKGSALWRSTAGTNGKSCAACHGDAGTSMKGVATRYPRTDPDAGRLQNLEGRINQCRERNQGAKPLEYESEALLALTAYVATQSRGLPRDVVIDARNRPNFERGRDFYFRRQGQMNLACTHCHDRNAGKRLLAEPISQGQSNGYPAYRLEWQTTGSLHRRLRSCLFGVRAELLPAGSPELVDLELYLAWRGRGLPIETPAVRR
jgi:sulfur-oxidizing protein SoxA